MLIRISAMTVTETRAIFLILDLSSGDEADRDMTVAFAPQYMQKLALTRSSLPHLIQNGIE